MDVLKYLSACLIFCGLSLQLFASEAVGYYSNGSLRDAHSVFERNSHVHKLFVSRQKLYTTDEMHDLLDDAAIFVRDNFADSEVLQVGDLSGVRGGEATRHASHQNGLDADVVYLRNNGYVQPQSAPEWEEYFVTNSKVSSNFNYERNLSLFRHMVANFAVDRIFVDQAIKSSMCRYVEKNSLNDPLTRETLRRLRIVNLHKTHFHVRLACPASDDQCIPQTPPPQGTGCNNLDLFMDELAQVTEKSC